MNRKYYHTKLATEILINKLKIHPTLMRCFKNKKYISQDIHDDIQERMNGHTKDFCTIFITGDQGSLKSSYGMSLAIKHDPSFNSKRISFIYEDFLENLKNSDPKQWLIIDEMPIIQGVGSQRIINNMQTIIETLRKRQNSLIIISPHAKYFPEELFTFTIQMLDTCRLGKCKNRNLHEVRTCPFSKKHDEMEVWARGAVKKHGIYIGLIETKIPWGDIIWEEYEIKKDEFIEKAKKLELRKNNLGAMSKDLGEKRDLSIYKRKKELLVVIQEEMAHLTTAEADMLATKIMMDRKQEESL